MNSKELSEQLSRMTTEQLAKAKQKLEHTSTKKQYVGTPRKPVQNKNG